MTKDELKAALKGVSDQLTKATAEIKTALQNSGTTDTETDSIVAGLQAASQALDDIEPDATA